MLKKPTELKLLSKDSKDIYANNIFEKYEKRTNQLKDVCLADFACNYNLKKNYYTMIQTMKTQIMTTKI